MEDWFEELKNGSHRDQLSFNYVLWKNQDVKVTYMSKTICKSEFFLWNGAHSRRINSTTPNNNIKPNVSNENTKTKSKVIDKIRERRRNIVKDSLKMRLL
jgi:hypothetical protein